MLYSATTDLRTSSTTTGVPGVLGSVLLLVRLPRAGFSIFRPAFLSAPRRSRRLPPLCQAKTVRSTQRQDNMNARETKCEPALATALAGRPTNQPTNKPTNQPATAACGLVRAFAPAVTATFAGDGLRSAATTSPGSTTAPLRRCTRGTTAIAGVVIAVGGAATSHVVAQRFSLRLFLLGAPLDVLR